MAAKNLKSTKHYILVEVTQLDGAEETASPSGFFISHSILSDINSSFNADEFEEEYEFPIRGNLALLFMLIDLWLFIRRGGKTAL